MLLDATQRRWSAVAIVKHVAFELKERLIFHNRAVDVDDFSRRPENIDAGCVHDVKAINNTLLPAACLVLIGPRKAPTAH